MEYTSEKEKYFYDVCYETWMMGGDPDSVDRDYTDDCYDNGCYPEECVPRRRRRSEYEEE